MDIRRAAKFGAVGFLACVGIALVFLFLTSVLDDEEPSPNSTEYPAYYMRMIQTDPLWAGRRPIEFYGRVIDENGSPVEGVSVLFRWTAITRKGTAEAHGETDSDGRFFLKGKKGKLLTVELEKTGYYVSERNPRAFEYASPHSQFFHVPDPDNPVDFHVRRQGTLAQLVSGNKLFRFPGDGTRHYVDLLRRKSFPEEPDSWDLAFEFTRGPFETNRQYDWSMNVTTSGDGLIETNVEFMFMAPSNGYADWSISFTSGMPGWERLVEPKFFFASRNGAAYGRIKAWIGAYYDQGAGVRLDYVLNTNGSRNLEGAK